MNAAHMDISRSDVFLNAAMVGVVVLFFTATRPGFWRQVAQFWVMFSVMIVWGAWLAKLVANQARDPILVDAKPAWLVLLEHGLALLCVFFVSAACAGVCRRRADPGNTGENPSTRARLFAEPLPKTPAGRL